MHRRSKDCFQEDICKLFRIVSLILNNCTESITAMLYYITKITLQFRENLLCSQHDIFLSQFS